MNSSQRMLQTNTTKHSVSSAGNGVFSLQEDEDPTPTFPRIHSQLEELRHEDKRKNCKVSEGVPARKQGLLPGHQEVETNNQMRVDNETAYRMYMPVGYGLSLQVSSYHNRSIGWVWHGKACKCSLIGVGSIMSCTCTCKTSDLVMDMTPPSEPNQ